jgi:hypothetical protein
MYCVQGSRRNRAGGPPHAQHTGHRHTYEELDGGGKLTKAHVTFGFDGFEGSTI